MKMIIISMPTKTICSIFFIAVFISEGHSFPSTFPGLDEWEDHWDYVHYCKLGCETNDRYSNDVNITLNAYSKANITTHCDSGLLEDDSIKLSGYIYNKTHFDETACVRLLLCNSEQEEMPMELLQYKCLKHCAGLSPYEELSCDNQSIPIKVAIVLNVTETLSLHYLQLQVNDTKHTYKSNKIRLPDIYSAENIKMKTGITYIRNNFTVLRVPVSFKQLEICCPKSLKPCIAVATINKTNRTSGPDCVSYKLGPRLTQNISVGYNVCNHSFIDRYQIQLKFDHKATRTESPSTTTKNGTISTKAIIFISIGFFLGLLLLAYIFRKKLRNIFYCIYNTAYALVPSH